MAARKMACDVMLGDTMFAKCLLKFVAFEAAYMLHLNGLQISAENG
jgi:hypothetical protein